MTRALEEQGQVLSNTIDFLLHTQPLKVRGQINEVLNGFLKPIMIKDLMAYNNKQSKPKTEPVLKEEEPKLELLTEEKVEAVPIQQEQSFISLKSSASEVRKEADQETIVQPSQRFIQFTKLPIVNWTDLRKQAEKEWEEVFTQQVKVGIMQGFGSSMIAGIKASKLAA